MVGDLVVKRKLANRKALFGNILKTVSTSVENGNIPVRYSHSPAVKQRIIEALRQNGVFNKITQVQFSAVNQLRQQHVRKLLANMNVLAQMSLI